MRISDRLQVAAQWIGLDEPGSQGRDQDDDAKIEEHAPGNPVARTLIEELFAATASDCNEGDGNGEDREGKHSVRT